MPAGEAEDHMATGPDLRIGDTERETTANILREHYAQGRLSLDEFNQRIDAVFSSKTQRDLNHLTRDLPHASAPSAPLPVAGVPGGGRERAGQGAGPGWGQHRHHGFGVFPLVIAALATWLLIFDLHLRAFPWPGKLAIFIAIFAFLRGLLRRVVGVRRGGGWPGRGCGRRR
jgi:hypothetical protein